MNLENEFQTMATGFQFKQCHKTDNEFDSFLDDTEDILNQCLPQIKQVLMDNFKPYLESKLKRTLTDNEVRHIIHSQLEPLSFTIADLL